jgi:hypothetical protein
MERLIVVKTLVDMGLVCVGSVSWKRPLTFPAGSVFVVHPGHLLSGAHLAAVVRS